ncbi:MAG: hypothetical protein LBB82_05640 [Treponema sp.]|jgi:hypothetical protein|nr:hypothetical protein [Treponema sp.]
MESDNFALYRDLFYLSFLFFGISAGAVLCRQRSGNTLRRRAAWLAAIYCFIACAAAFLSPAVVFSGGAVFTVKSIYLVCAVFFFAGAAGIYFPRSAGAALVFAAGIITIWIALAFARYPEFQTAEGPPYVESFALRSFGDGVRLVRQNRKPDTADAAESWSLDYEESPLVFEAAAFSAHRLFPLVGGEKRGLITRVSRGGEVLFSVSPWMIRPLSRSRPGFSSRIFSLDLPAGALLPGMNLSVVFDGDSLVFDPPIHISDEARP